MNTLILYIDPGTGSLIFQALAAAGMGILVAFQSVREWVKGCFFSIFKRKGKNKDDLEK